MKQQNKLNGMRVLVTGGAGFLGSEVVRQLYEQNAEVTVFDNFSSGKIEYIERFDKAKVVKGDVCNKDAFSKVLNDQEIVVHLAALPFIPDCYYLPEEFFRVNTMGSVNALWRSIQSETVRLFVHISSSEVYGTAKCVPMDEEHPTIPHSSYAASKLAAERAVFTLHKEHDFPAAIIRPFNCYGPNITQPYIIPEIILQLLTGNDRIQLGNAESSRDFTYVSDTARGIVLALTEKRAIGETINLGTGKDIKIRDLAYLIAKRFGKPEITIEMDATRLRPYDVNQLVCDNMKAQKILGWKPQISLEEGLKRIIEWLMNNPMVFKGPFGGWPRAYRFGEAKDVQG